MSKLFHLIVIVILSSFSWSTAFAQTANTGSFKDISFIEGHWKATFNGLDVEGVWLAPETDNMVGMMRMSKDGKVNLYEILAYEQQDKGLISFVKHFKPGLLGVEEKDKQDVYTFVSSGNNWAEFEKHDGGHIRYEKRTNDRFVISRGTQKNGKWEFADLFVFDRVK